MGNHYHRRDTCRLCASAGLANAFSLAPTPLANAFVTRDALAREQRFGGSDETRLEQLLASRSAAELITILQGGLPS